MTTGVAVHAPMYDACRRLVMHAGTRRIFGLSVTHQPSGPYRDSQGTCNSSAHTELVSKPGATAKAFFDTWNFRSDAVHIKRLIFTVLMRELSEKWRHSSGPGTYLSPLQLEAFAIVTGLTQVVAQGPAHTHRRGSRGCVEGCVDAALRAITEASGGVGVADTWHRIGQDTHTQPCRTFTSPTLM